MIILHPDHLISATVVADAISCQRRAVLQDRVKAFGELGKPQVFGVIFHEIFQEALKANRWDLDSLRVLVENVVARHIEELYVIHMSIAEAVGYVMDKIPALKAWADTFLRVKPDVSFLAMLSTSSSELAQLTANRRTPMWTTVITPSST